MKIVVLGGGGHAAVVAEILMQHGTEFEIVGVLDRTGTASASSDLAIPRIGDDSNLAGLRGEGVEGAIAAVGDNRLRRELFERATAAGFRIVRAIHPGAIISPSASVQDGTVIMAGVVVNARASIGENAILNTGATIDHHCLIERDVHIAPGATLGGGVEIGEGALIGIGAVILPRVRIGRGSVVGGGAVVVRDVPPGRTVVGVPAR